MAASAATQREATNPLDRVERLAESKSWHLDRTNDHEVIMLVGGGWADLTLSFNWRDDLESLHFACTLDLKVPDKRRDEAIRLFNIVNAQLVHGHFDLWQNGTIIYRYALLLAGGAVANDEQCEAIIHMGVETMHTYYPAINFVIWAGQSADEALKNALLETMGEA